MAILLTARKVSKSFGARPLFDALDFVIEDTERTGLIGPNGAGKSTLLKILARQTSPDTGEVSFQRGVTVGFLEQTPQLPLDVTVETAVWGDDLEKHDPQSMALTGEVLSKLDLVPKSQQLVGNLSGGWRKRVALARELTKAPQLLLLDEPTNHLDIESILWLETFLRTAPFATLIVTHDRLFLQRVTNRIMELDRRNPGGLLSVKGDYATYLEQKENQIAVQQKQEVVLQNKLRRETEWLRRGPKARTTKQQARINAAGELAKEVEDLEYRNRSRTAKIDFQGSDRKPKRLIEATNISKRYGDRVLFSKFNLLLGPGNRVGLLGNNGCGKSTLIRVLLGTEAPDEGTVFHSEHLKVAFFEQNREALDPEKTLRKTVCPDGDHVNFRGQMVHVNGYLDRFLFKKEQADIAVKRLSGGEQSRVLLALLMLREANVLVLDEPTNDLDVETLDVLETCLTDFDGAVILVTHDRYFLDQVADEIYAFDPAGKGITVFAGLSQWENHQAEKAAASSREAKAVKAESQAAPKKKKLSYNEVRELEQMEANILKAESRLEALKRETELPENMANAGKLTSLFNDLAQAQAEVERLYARWAELETPPPK